MKNSLPMNKVWPFAYFFLFFAAIAAHMPYLVLYFQALNFSGAQIGLLAGISPLITLVSVPLWTRAADRSGRHRAILGLAMLVPVVGLLVYPFLRTFEAVLMVTLVNNVFFSPALSLANSATMFMLGADQDQYGRLRLGGTIGFGLTSLVAGVLVQSLGLNAAFWLAAVLIFGAFLVSLQLRFGEEEAQAAGDQQGIGTLLRRPEWLIFLSIAFISGVAMAAGNSYFFPYMQELGIEQSLMGVALAIGTLAEIPVMLLSDRFIGRLGAYGTMIFSTALTGARLVLFGLVASAAAVMAIQVLNGLSIPLFMVAGVTFAERHAPRALRSTAQGLLNAALMGVGTAVGGFLCGLMLPVTGAATMYLVIGVLVFLVLAVVVLLRGRLPVAVDVPS